MGGQWGAWPESRDKWPHGKFSERTRALEVGGGDELPSSENPAGGKGRGDMKALILAAGLGTRLRPITHLLPKPMLPVFGVPLIEHIVVQLKDQGIDRIFVNLHHMPEKVMDHLQDGRRLGVEIRYSLEPKILGTAGAIKKLEEELRGAPFLVVNGDTVRPISLEALLERHRALGKAVTLLLQEDPEGPDSESVFLSEGGEVAGFWSLGTREAPSCIKPCHFLGVQVMEPEVLSLIPRDTFWEAQKLWKELLQNGLGLAGYCEEGYWKDLGTVDAYLELHRDFLDGRAKGLIPARELKKGIWMGKDVSIGGEVEIISPVFLGEGTLLGKGSKVGPYAIVGPKSQLGGGSRAERCIIWREAKIESKKVVREEIVGDGVRIFVPWPE
jgi:mannose-1-phosphate guanylyltransferase